MPAWMAAGALGDAVAFYALPAGIQWLEPFVGWAWVALPTAASLVAVWLVHAVAMPALAARNLPRPGAGRLAALGAGFVAAGTVAVLGGGFGAGLAMVSAMKGELVGLQPDAWRDAGPWTLVGAYVLGGAAAGAALHPFVARALPRGAHVRFWGNVAAGALGAGLLASPVLAFNMLVAGWPLTAVLVAALWLLPVLACLPHLWLTGRAVRRALALAAPA